MTMTVVEAGVAYRFKHVTFFDDHQYGSDLGIPSGRIEIHRVEDDTYWNGTTWQSGAVWNATTVDGGGLFDYYDFTIPSDSDGETIQIRMQHHDDPVTEYCGDLFVKEAVAIAQQVLDSLAGPSAKYQS